MPAPAERGGVLAVLTAGILWGTGGLAGSLLGDRSGIGAIAVAGYRLAVGGVLLVGWSLVTGRLRAVRPERRGVRRLLSVGATAAWYQCWFFAAIELSSVGLATLLTLGAAPVMVVAAESVRARRRPAAHTVVAMAVAAVGLALLVGVPGADGTGTAIAGAACALASAAGFAAITILGARPVPGMTALPTIGLGFCVGGAIICPLAMLVGDVAIGARADAVLLMLYLGLVPTAIAYVLYFLGLRGVAAGTAVLMSLLEPSTAAVLGIVLLKERLSPFGVVGGVLIGAALVITAPSRGDGRRHVFNR